MKKEEMMFKKAVLYSSFGLLAACGGSDGSGNAGGSGGGVPEKIVIDATNSQYAALKVGDGEWEMLPAEKTELTAPGADKTVTVVTICRSSDNQQILLDMPGEALSIPTTYEMTVDQRQGSNGYTAQTNYCDKPFPDVYRVNLNFTNSDIQLVSYTMTNYYQTADGSYIELYPGDEPRTFMAIGYRVADQKAFVYRRDNLQVEAGDTITVDFTDPDYGSEATYITAPNKNGFEYSPVYVNRDQNVWINLDLWTVDPVAIIQIPEKFRRAGDIFENNWGFGEDSSYIRFTNELDTETLELTDAPVEPRYSELSNSMDGLSAKFDYTGYEFEGLPLNRIEVELRKSVRELNVVVNARYQVFPPKGAVGEVAFPLINVDDLPGYEYTIPDLTAEDVSSMYTRFMKNGDFGPGGRILYINHKDDPS